MFVSMHYMRRNAEVFEAMSTACVKRNASQSDQTGNNFLLTGDACHMRERVWPWLEDLLRCLAF